jgi:hypothetical protein
MTCAAALGIASGVFAQSAPTNASHEAEAQGTVAAPASKEKPAKPAAPATPSVKGNTKGLSKSASADAENPGVGESSGNADEVARKAEKKAK